MLQAFPVIWIDIAEELLDIYILIMHQAATQAFEGLWIEISNRHDNNSVLVASRKRITKLCILLSCHVIFSHPIFMHLFNGLTALQLYVPAQ